MPVDASIYGLVQQPKLIEQPNQLASLAQAYQLKGMQSQIAKADREEMQANRLADLYRTAVDPEGNIDRKALFTGAATNGLGAQIPAMQKTLNDQDKAARDAEKARLETGMKHFEAVGQIMNGVRDQASLDLARQQAAEVFGAKAAANIPSVYDPAVIARNQAQALSVKEQIESRYKALTMEETQRHNRATEGTAAANLGVAQGNLGVSRDRLEFDRNSPRGQVVQTDVGTMLVDPRTGEARPVMAGGQPVQKPAKDIPAAVNKSIIENQQSISKIDRAIAAINDPKAEGSLGPLNLIPGMEQVRQYTDPEGVVARAGIADIGSLILHDRSGAAVTASETPRLKPFIPSPADSRETAIKKLNRFKEIYEEEAGLLAQTYGKDQGYKEAPAFKAKPAGQPKGAGAAPPDKAIAFLKANPGMRAQFEQKYGVSADSYLGK